MYGIPAFRCVLEDENPDVFEEVLNAGQVALALVKGATCEVVVKGR